MSDSGPDRRGMGGDPSPLDTAEFSLEEIRDRLERGRVHVRMSGDESRLEVARTDAPEPGRMRYSPLEIPTLFPEQGPILLLVVGGFADDGALDHRTPFWNDDHRGGALLWQALQRSGFVHRQDRDLAVGQGGFWEAEPPRTSNLAMTYSGYRRPGEAVDFDLAVRGWNIHRLQTLVQECMGRSMGRLRVVAVGESAAFMMSGCLFGIHGIPLLSLPEPTPECLDQAGVGRNRAADYWIEWAMDLMEAGRG
jgi:hypothetical protein